MAEHRWLDIDSPISSDEPTTARLWLPPACAMVACLFSGWMLLGIRHTNHDDIYFDLLAHNSNVGVYQATIQLAHFLHPLLPSSEHTCGNGDNTNC
jgi:hypothetical protein